MTPSRDDSHDNPERDAWLTEALRHAPDADAAPPAALREAILREARAATAGTRAATAPSTAHRLLAAWSWLARPPVAAGFASVMVATLIGMMWWGRPIDETWQRPPVPAPTSVPVAQPPAAPTPAGDGVAAQPEPPGPPAPPAPAARTDKAAARAIAKPAAPPTPALPPRTAPAAFSDERPSVAAAPATEALGAAQGAVVPSPRLRESAPRVEAEAPAIVARDDSTMRSDVPSLRALAKASPAPSSGGALASAQRKSEAATGPAAPLNELLASVAEQPQRWSWQRGASARPLGPALQRWLQQLERAAAPRWRAPDGTPPTPVDGRILHLYRDNAPYATLQLDDDSVWLVPASPTARPARALLPAAMLADLTRTLDEAAP